MQQPWKVVAAFIGIFVAGAVFGAFITLGTGARWAAAQPAPLSTPAAPPAPAPEKTVAAHPPSAGPNAPTSPPRPGLLQVPQGWQAPQILRRYSERLDLTPEQKERMRPLFQRAAEDYRRVQQNTFRDTGFILRRLQQDIAKELTPEQREKLQKWEEAQAEKLQKVDPRPRDLKKAQKEGGRMNKENSELRGGTGTGSATTSAEAGVSAEKKE